MNRYHVQSLGCVEAQIDEVLEAFGDPPPIRVLEWAGRLRAFLKSLAHMPHRFPSTGKRNREGDLIRQTLFGKRRGAWRILYSIDDTARIVTVFQLQRGGRGPLSSFDLA